MAQPREFPEGYGEMLSVPASRVRGESCFTVSAEPDFPVLSLHRLITEEDQLLRRLFSSRPREEGGHKHFLSVSQAPWPQ
jgi:hypothetical protein